MTAQPDVIGAIGPDDVMKVRVGTMDAIAATLDSNELELKSLKRQRDGVVARMELLKAEKAEAEIRLQTQLLKVHSDYLDRLTKLEESVAALDEAQNRTGNIVQGLPTREEFQQLRDDHDNLSYRVPV